MYGCARHTVICVYVEIIMVITYSKVPQKVGKYLRTKTQIPKQIVVSGASYIIVDHKVTMANSIYPFFDG